VALYPEHWAHLPLLESKVFFSEEKKQKTFANEGACAARARPLWHTSVLNKCAPNSLARHQPKNLAQLVTPVLRGKCLGEHISNRRRPRRRGAIRQRRQRQQRNKSWVLDLYCNQVYPPEIFEELLVRQTHPNQIRSLEQVEFNPNVCGLHIYLYQQRRGAALTNI